MIGKRLGGFQSYRKVVKTAEKSKLYARKLSLELSSHGDKIIYIKKIQKIKKIDHAICKIRSPFYATSTVRSALYDHDQNSQIKTMSASTVPREKITKTNQPPQHTRIKIKKKMQKDKGNCKHT